MAGDVRGGPRDCVLSLHTNAGLAPRRPTAKSDACILATYHHQSRLAKHTQSADVTGNAQRVRSHSALALKARCAVLGVPR
eukprot:scaffold133698_cov30-Tisochrysis_lutea.AAC.3